MHALHAVKLAHLTSTAVSAIGRPGHIRYWLTDNVTLSPTGAGAPGASFIQTALNWMGQYGLWACLAAVLLGGMTYGFSTYAGNSYRAAHGRSVALAGAVGAVIIGLGPSIINLLFNAA
jgi:hypothetical protein